jgi:AraC-like DNA-binding protein
MKNQKRGRPEFNATKARREIVEILRAAGFTEPAIATAIGCSEKTLRDRFRADLDNGSVRINARIAAAVFQAAERGNVAAARLWRSEFVGIESPRKPRRRPLGKKEIADLEAQTAGNGTSWGDLLDSPSDIQKAN